MTCFQRWRGDPAEKKGCYLSAHAEKQLGIWVLMESMSQALGTKQITIENIARLKELSQDLPVRLRETQIELDHEPCSSCIKVSLSHKPAQSHIITLPIVE